MRKITWLATIGLLSLFGGIAQSDVIYSFDQNSYSVAPGASFDVTVRLQDSGGMTTLADEGLFAVGVAVDFAGLTLTNVTTAAGFDRFGASSGSSPEIIQLFATPPAFGVDTGSPFDVATLTFQAPSNPGQLTLTARDPDPDPLFANTISGQGNVLDPQSNAIASVQIGSQQVVPEPTSAVLFGAALAGVGYVCRRRARMRSRIQ